MRWEAEEPIHFLGAVMHAALRRGWIAKSGCIGTQKAAGGGAPLQTIPPGEEEAEELLFAQPGLVGGRKGGGRCAHKWGRKRKPPKSGSSNT